MSEENKEGAGAVVSRMENVAQNNAVLSEKIDSTMNMTNDINEQVGNVAGLVEHIVEISEKSAPDSVRVLLKQPTPWQSFRQMSKIF